MSIADEVTSDGRTLLFTLSPNDLVYVKEDDSKISENDNLDVALIYKAVSFNGPQSFFIPSFIANPIVKALELGSGNKAERAWNDSMIKSVCCKLCVDRLGRVIKIIQ